MFLEIAHSSDSQSVDQAPLVDCEGVAVGLIVFVLKFVPVAGTLSTKKEFGKCC